MQTTTYYTDGDADIIESSVALTLVIRNETKNKGTTIKPLMVKEGYKRKKLEDLRAMEGLYQIGGNSALLTGNSYVSDVGLAQIHKKQSIKDLQVYQVKVKEIPELLSFDDVYEKVGKFDREGKKGESLGEHRKAWDKKIKTAMTSGIKYTLSRELVTDKYSLIKKLEKLNKDA